MASRTLSATTEVKPSPFGSIPAATLLKRHYSTIGIEDVFMTVEIDAVLLPRMYHHSITPQPRCIEIVGTIKGEPEDFIVKEISKRSEIIGPRIADVEISSLQSDCDDKRSLGGKDIDNKVLPKDNPETKEMEIEATMDPKAIMLKILSQHQPSMVESILSRIQDLHGRSVAAVENSVIDDLDTDASLDDVITIESIPSQSSCLVKEANQGGDRGSFHRAINIAFPLLQSQTKEATIYISVDITFSLLAKCLINPSENLIRLYRFRNKGYPGPSPRQRRNKRKRSNSQLIENTDHQVILPLKIGLSKDDRRNVHHLISKGFKYFQTDTYSDFPINDGQSTAAIIVTWSSRAQKKKSTVNTLCIMKKRQKEHLTALQILSSALRCRLSDIGTAGIKDMQAITHQFVTIQGREPQSFSEANSRLEASGIKLGHFQPVQWTLNQGDLAGNRFRIVLRNLKRVQIKAREEGSAPIEEYMTICSGVHLCERIRAVETCGFVNFYGEQRLGIPGDANEVGVRPFEIGKAMLQQKFSLAIDLIMRGRRMCRASGQGEHADIQKVRKVWQDSNGNVDDTLKAMPKGEMMGRERAILKGLKRYGNPLEALKCLHFGVRTFWINAYQALIWNKMASERLQMSHKVLIGDLALDNDGKVKIIKDLEGVHIFQVVLPLPGYNTVYPEHGIRKSYQKILKADNVTFNKEAPLEATAKGSYRHLVVKPKNISSDVEVESAIVNTCSLTFDLPPGSYATMLLRELMVSTVSRPIVA